MDSSNFEQPIWYVGHHESKRCAQISEQMLREAQAANVSTSLEPEGKLADKQQYDMLTTSITTPQFHSNVQAILSTYIAESGHEHKRGDLPVPLIPPLKPEDSPLFPTDSIAQYIAISSPWIDLASPDPIISNVSRQILHLELAYAAFCGIQHVIIRAPHTIESCKRHQIISQFARAISEALAIGQYLQLHILFPISPGKGKGSEDHSHLSRFAQLNTSQTDSNSGQNSEAWEPWEAWDLIRNVCNYSGRITIGM
jgi:protein arginine N-methyltransferase 5